MFTAPVPSTSSNTSPPSRTTVLGAPRPRREFVVSEGDGVTRPTCSAIRHMTCGAPVGRQIRSSRGKSSSCTSSWIAAAIGIATSAPTIPSREPPTDDQGGYPAAMSSMVVRRKPCRVKQTYAPSRASLSRSLDNRRFSVICQFANLGGFRADAVPRSSPRTQMPRPLPHARWCAATAPAQRGSLGVPACRAVRRGAVAIASTR
jgi:hypothetical protein